MNIYEHFSHEAVELLLYVENDRAVHDAYLIPALRNLTRHYRADRFHRELGIKGMRRAVDAAAKDYNLRHGSMSTPWHELFSKSDRDKVAEYLVDDFLDRTRSGDEFWMAKR